MSGLRQLEPEPRPEKPAAEPSEPTGPPPPYSRLPAEALATLAEIGASHLARGLQTVAEWSAAMIGDIAHHFDCSAPARSALDWIGPHLGEIWEASQKEFDRLIDRASEEEGIPEEEKAALKEAVIWRGTKELTGNTVKAVEEKIAKRYEEQGDITTESVNKLTKMIIESGVHGQEAIFSALDQALAKIKPEITRCEVADLLSGYGQSATNRGEGIRRSPVSSSALRSVGYDEGQKILEIEWTNGTVLRFLDVPAKVYHGLMAAESHGRYLHQHVLGAGYRQKNMK